MYTFKRITNRQWQGNGKGTSSADHELCVNGQATGITLTGMGGTRYNVHHDNTFDIAYGFDSAKAKAISIYLA